MARTSKSRSSKNELPPPLPPERRTVGQLIAESIRLYGANFLRALPLGLVVAVSNQFAIHRSTLWAGAVFVIAAPFFTLAFTYATRLVTGAAAPRRALLVALVAGTLVFVPAAALIPWFKLAVVLWLALVGLVVPVAIVEQTSFRESFRRALALGRADYVHAAGSLAALVVLFGLAEYALTLVLHSQAENAVRSAIFLADVVLGPLLFIGAALLYVDQEARLRSRAQQGEERDGDLPDADHADREGRPDAPRESRSPA
jgi:hypothetical protein